MIYPGGLAPGGMPMYERLLVAVDHSEVSDRVIAAARDIATLSKGKVWVLHLQEREWGRVGRTPTESDEEAREAVTQGVQAPPPRIAAVNCGLGALAWHEVFRLPPGASSRP